MLGKSVCWKIKTSIYLNQMMSCKYRNSFVKIQNARNLLNAVLHSYCKLILNDELEDAELILPMLEFSQRQFSQLYIKYLKECDEYKGNVK